MKGAYTVTKSTRRAEAIVYLLNRMLKKHGIKVGQLTGPYMPSTRRVWQYVFTLEMPAA